MGPEDRRGGRASGKDEFEGRDLLVGRPQGAEGRPGAGAEQSPTAATSSQVVAHESTIREILEKVRAMAAKIDTLLSATGPENETTEALARETAALAQAVEGARGTLADAAGLAARREEEASSGARVLPNALGRLRTRLAGHDDGDRQFVKVLAAVQEDGLEAVEAACAEALDCGACSADVVLNILARQRQPAPPAAIPTPEGLQLRHQPVADCQRYDSLREAGHGAS